MTVVSAASDVGFATQNEKSLKTRVKNELVRKKPQTHRVQLEMPPMSYNRLEALKEMTEAASFAEVIRNALRLYDDMVKEVANGREFLIRDPGVGNITPYRALLKA